MQPRSRTAKTAFLSGASALTGVAGLATAAILSRLLTRDDYATYKQAILVYNLAAAVLVLGLPQALNYFLPNAGARSRALVIENMAILAVSGGLFGVFLLAGGNQLIAARFANPALVQALLIIAPYPLLAFTIRGIDAVLVVQNRVSTLTVYAVATRVGSTILVIAAAILWPGSPLAPLAALVIAALAILAPSMALQLGACPAGPASPSWASIGRQLGYAVPLGLAAMVGTLARLIDKLIVASMCPAEEFAIYVNGAVELPLVGVLTGSATAVLLPDMVRLCGDGRRADALAIWRRAAVKCALVIFPATCFFMALATPIVTLLFSDKYVASAAPLRMYLLLLPVRIVFFAAAIMALGRSRTILFRACVGLCVNAVLSIFLVRLFGYLGAVAGTILTVYGWDVLFNLWFIAREYDRPMTQVLPLDSLLRVMGLSIVATVVLIPAAFLSQVPAAIQLVVFLPLYAGAVALLFVRSGTVDKATVIAAATAAVNKIRGR